MKLSISNLHVRKAVYRAFKGQCFFTGRPISEEEMVIDHLIPKSKGGQDSFENFVLTFRDLNAGKSSKLDDELKKMAWSVKNIYAPRAIKLHIKFSQKNNFFIQNHEEQIEIKIKKFKTKLHPPNNLKTISYQDLFWVKDNKVEVLTDTDCLKKESTYEILRMINCYSSDIIRNEADYSHQAFLNDEMIKSIKSLWMRVDNQFFKVVKKVDLYEKDADYHFTFVYFTKQYVEYLKWRESTDELLQNIFEIDDADECEKCLEIFCTYFPKPTP